MPTTIPTPDSTPRWEAPDTAVIEPAPAVSSSGWPAAESAPGAATNWFWRLTSRWLSYLADVVKNSYGAEHDLVTGAHREVTALNVTSDLASFQTVAAEQGNILGLSVQSVYVGGSFTSDGEFRVHPSGALTAPAVTTEQVTSRVFATSGPGGDFHYDPTGRGFKISRLHLLSQVGALAEASIPDWSNGQGSVGALSHRGSTVAALLLDAGENGRFVVGQYPSNADLDALIVSVHLAASHSYVLVAKLQWLDTATLRWETLAEHQLSGSASPGIAAAAPAVVEHRWSLEDAGAVHAPGNGLHLPSGGIFAVQILNYWNLVSAKPPRASIFAVRSDLRVVRNGDAIGGYLEPRRAPGPH